MAESGSIIATLAQKVEVLRREYETIRDETKAGANTATRIGKAFLDLLSLIGQYDDIYLHAYEEDVANELIKFMKGAEFGTYAKGLSGARIDGYGDAEFRKLEARVRATVRELIVGKFATGVHDSGAYVDEKGNAEFEKLVTRALATLASLWVKGDSVFGGSLSSEDFISGFLGGLGWAIQRKEFINSAGVTEYKYTLEIDNAVIRNTLRVFEMIISQLLGENDNRVFTAMMEVHHYDPETGKVWMKTNGERSYMYFRKGDCIMVQQYLPGNTVVEGGDGYVTKSYELLITDVGTGGMQDEDGNRLDWVAFTNFATQMEGDNGANMSADDLIAEGDTFVRVDNISDPDRKGIVTMMTVGSNTPYEDIIYGLKTDPDNALKGRIGNMEGIHHHLLGWLYGFGIYTNNFFGVGDLRIRRTGESLDTAIEILRDMMATNFAETVYDMTDDDNLLSNASFTELNEDGSFKDWHVLSDEMNFWTVNGEAVVSSVGTLADVQSACKTDEVDGKQVLHVVNSSLSQANDAIAKPGYHKEYDEGDSDSQTETFKNVSDTLYMSIRIRVLKGGTLSIGFSNSDGTDALGSRTEVLEKSTEWKTLQWSGTWNGAGEFALSFTGECYVSLLSVTTEPLSNFKTEYSTQIKQTARNITLIATRTSANETSIAQLEIRADSITSTVQQNYETLDGKIGRNTSKIEQTATAIRTEVTSIKDELDGKISDNYSTLEQTATAIRTEVTEKYTDLDGKIGRNTSKIEQTATAIRTEVTSIKDELDGKISDNYSTLEQTATAIRTEVTEKYTDLDGKIGRNTSKIEQTATEINLRVSNVSNDVTTKYNDLNGKIGTANSNISSLTTRVGSLEVSDTSINGTVSELQTKVNTNTGSISSLSATLSEVSSTATSASQKASAIEADMASLRSLEDVELWEYGSTSGESVGKTYDQIKSTANDRVRTKTLIPCCGDYVAVFVGDDYQVGFNFFDTNKRLINTYYWSGWQYPVDGKVVANSHGAAYAAVLLRYTSPSGIPSTGIQMCNVNTVSSAEISTFITRDEASGEYVSWADMKADNISFEFSKRWSVSAKNKGEVMYLNTDGDLYLKGNIYGGNITGELIIGTGTKKMFIEPTESGARLVGKESDNIVLNLGFIEKGGVVSSGLQYLQSYNGVTYASYYNPNFFLIQNHPKNQGSSSLQGIVSEAGSALNLTGRNGFTLEIRVDNSGLVKISPNSLIMWPNSSTDVGVGGVYRDGDNLKVRTS